MAGESAWIQVSNGLRQGCVVPMLFLLYFNMVMLCWRVKCAGFRVKLMYKCGRSLLVRGLGRLAMSSLVVEMYFADDAVITASTREDIAKATMELQRVTAECISFSKTKLMVAGTGIIESN